MNLERSSAAQFDVALGQHLALHLDGSILKSDDLHVPGYAFDGDVRDGLAPEQRNRGHDFGGNPRGSVPNTNVFARSFGFGTSWIWDKDYGGFSYHRLLTIFGVPDDSRVDDPLEEPVRTHIDLRSNQFNLRGEVQDPFTGVAKLLGKFSYSDYKHAELDGSAVGSTFRTTGFNSRLEAQQQK